MKKQNKINNRISKQLINNPNIWRFLKLEYINKCDLIERQNKNCNSIFELPKIKNVHIYLNSWEAQKGCDEFKNKTISHEDFQIGLVSLLQTFINNNIKIEKRKKEYTVIIKAKKKSKMKKNIVLESYSFRSILKSQENIYTFLEYIFLEIVNTSNIKFLKRKKISTIKGKSSNLSTISINIPLNSFSDLIEHNRLNLNEMFILKNIKLHININIEHQSKKVPLNNIYPFWLTETYGPSELLNDSDIDSD